jgi:hypothetical protein
MQVSMDYQEIASDVNSLIQTKKICDKAIGERLQDRAILPLYTILRLAI